VFIAKAIPKKASTTAPPEGPQTSAFTWVKAALGLNADEYPRELSMPGITPVLEMANGPMVLTQWPNPAAGTGVGLLLPVGPFDWEVQYIEFVLTTSAAVANRVANLALAFGGYKMQGNFTQTAGLTVVYLFAATGVIGQASSLVASESTILMPAPFGLRLSPIGIGANNPDINITVDNIQAGDQISSIVMYARKQLSGGPNLQFATGALS